jgi:hypothetical protein
MIRVKGSLFIRFRDMGLGGSDERVPHIHGNEFNMSSLNGARCQFSAGVSAHVQQTARALNIPSLLQANHKALELLGYSRTIVSTRTGMNCFIPCAENLSRPRRT